MSTAAAPSASLRRPLQRVRAGALRSRHVASDPALFAQVYEQHHQEIYRYCRSILGQEHDAQDALQTVMTQAYDALGREQRDFALRPWLFRIAHNTSVSMLRTRRPTTELDLDHASPAPDVEAERATRARLATLWADLQDLPDATRSALVLRELSGLGHDEIAAVLERTPGAVKQLIFEARTALHDCAEGRDMACDAVRRALSDGDGRVLRGRRMRAHLRACPGCRRFQDELRERPAELAALAPALPLVAGLPAVAHLLGGGGASASAGGGAVGGGTVTAGVLGGKVVAAIAVAVVATGATGAAVASHVAGASHHRAVRSVPASTPVAHAAVATREETRPVAIRVAATHHQSTGKGAAHRRHHRTGARTAPAASRTAGHAPAASGGRPTAARPVVRRPVVARPSRPVAARPTPHRHAAPAPARTARPAVRVPVAPVATAPAPVAPVAAVPVVTAPVVTAPAPAAPSAAKGARPR